MSVFPKKVHFLNTLFVAIVLTTTAVGFSIVFDELAKPATVYPALAGDHEGDVCG